MIELYRPGDFELPCYIEIFFKTFSLRLDVTFVLCKHGIALSEDRQEHDLIADVPIMAS